MEWYLSLTHIDRSAFFVLKGANANSAPTSREQITLKPDH